MNGYTNHIKILMYFCLALLIVFIVAFCLEFTHLCLSTLIAVAILVFLIVVLARGNNEIGETD